MGVVHQATHVENPGMPAQQARMLIILLSVCMALNMVSFGMIFPLFARKLEAFGNGVTALATSLIAYSLAGIIAAPIMGLLADRIGRKPLLVGSLGVYVAAFAGYLLAPSSFVFIVIRGLVGGLTAGLGPASMGIVADISPDNERGRWIGVLTAGGAIGWIVGPVFGGWLFDNYGLGLPFMISIWLGILAYFFALFIMPETYSRQDRLRDKLHRKHTEQAVVKKSAAASFWSSLPQPLPAFGILLFVNLSMIFAWFFIDPHLPFYIFDELGWSTAQFGSAISLYGWASLIGSLTLGQTSDRFGRKTVLIIALILHSAQYVGLMTLTTYWPVVGAFILAGLGESMLHPALNVSFLDITPPENRAQALGIKTAFGNLGSLAAPALVIVVLRVVSPQSVFAISAGLLLFTALLVLVGLRLPSKTEAARYSSWEVSPDRIVAAQTALHNVALSASTIRNLKKM
jgi:DHA1 family multidrug resistance protein-like MFS transporter